MHFQFYNTIYCVIKQICRFDHSGFKLCWLLSNMTILHICVNLFFRKVKTCHISVTVVTLRSQIDLRPSSDPSHWVRKGLVMLPLVLTRERTLPHQPNQLLIAESNHLLSIIYVVMSSFFNMIIDLFNTQKYLE